MQRPIIDLHCDLLLYLQDDPGRTPFDTLVRCAIPQMRSGHVKVQVMALFTETAKGCAELGVRQADIFKVLPNRYPEQFELVQTGNAMNLALASDKIGIIAAIENASIFAEESDTFEQIVDRLHSIIGRIGRPLYIGLTWNGENRFGGGAQTQVGLKEDGRRLLDWLQGRKIAVDFSHASDRLIEDILRYIDEKKLQIPLMASHSNFRSVADMPRNLPDELAKEIFKRKGVIGLNFVRSLLGEGGNQAMIAQLERAIDLGGEGNICFGADFFFEGDLPKASLLAASPEGRFYPEFADSSCYPQVLSLWKDELFISDEVLEKIAHRNLLRFMS